MAEEMTSESGELQKAASEEPQMTVSNKNITDEGKPPESTVADTGTRHRMISESSLNEDGNAELQETCREAFNKITEYLNGELTASLDDYELLEKLNNLSTSKYEEMSKMAKTLIASMEELDDKYKNLQPYLEQIDKVEDSVASLEQAAYRLDAYSKKLETRFKRLEKR